MSISTLDILDTTFGVGVTFTYTKAKDGSVSEREGCVMEITNTSKGKRVWILDGEGFCKQFDPAGMSNVRVLWSEDIR